MFIGEKERQSIHWIANMHKLLNEHSAWSQATFGTDMERGPMGPLKHLEKESIEARTSLEVFGKHDSRYHVELADIFLLLLDVSRRSGLTFSQLIDIAYKKLQICKTRSYPKVDPGNNDAVEHDRATDDGMPVRE